MDLAKPKSLIYYTKLQQQQQQQQQTHNASNVVCVAQPVNITIE